MASKRAVLYASLLLPLAIAMPWSGPMPTPRGLMALVGVSPRPTEAPGLNGVPRELTRRENVEWPPPANWCGFVNGIYDDPLSCNLGLTCVNSGEAIGCCTATTGYCSALYTTCANYLDQCGQLCLQNPAILKCNDAFEPYCGTYAFEGDTTLFNCMATSMLIQDVEFLNDFYRTAIGSTLAPSPTQNPFGFTPSVSLNSHAATSTHSAAGSGSGSGSVAVLAAPTSSASTHPGHSGLPQGAIDGIAAGVAIIGVLIFALVAFCCVRTRRRKRNAMASNPPAYTPPPMQEQAQQAQPPKAFDGYPPNTQQEQQHTQYPGPHQQAQPYLPPPASAVSPQSTSASDPRFSTTNTSLLSARPSEAEQRQSYHKAPLSPTVTEMDGTTGNPGVPAGTTHPVPTEVDGTMGNPGVPTGGHGIENQLMPGGSPSAAEIEGRESGGGFQAPPVRRHVGQQGTLESSMYQPYSDGPYEMGHEGRVN